MFCSICINTYKRPIFLKKLLDSLSTQNLNSDITLEIIVVDNDLDKQAENVVREFQIITTASIKYFEQPIKNISLTRNKAVKEATGEFILFIDDDGYADRNWISEMVQCITKYNADAVFGSVIPYFDERSPVWIKKSHYFDRLIQKTGEESKFTRTGNCIIKSGLIKSVDGPFDPEFGLTGGEDGNLFGKLAKKGAKFIFCAEAIVYDYIPFERANLKWLTKRSFSIGITTIEVEILISKNKIGTKIYLFLKGILYSIISTFLLVICFPSKLWRCHWFLKLIGNLGHICAIFNIRFNQYEI